MYIKYNLVLYNDVSTPCCSDLVHRLVQPKLLVHHIHEVVATETSPPSIHAHQQEVKIGCKVQLP